MTVESLSGSDSSQDLVRLVAGDEETLSRVFLRHRDRLWRMVSFRLDRRLAGRVDEDDILQEAYLDAAQRLVHLHQSPPPSAFLWLRLIVQQTIINVHRRHLGAQMRDAGREIRLQGMDSGPDTSVALAARLLGSLTTPSVAAMRAELTGQVEEALSSLSSLDREILALRHFEELTNAEVAEVLGIQQKAASIRYVRALTRLHKALARIPGFDGPRPE